MKLCHWSKSNQPTQVAGATATETGVIPAVKGDPATGRDGPVRTFSEAPFFSL
jgi:hypothetical protein